MSDTSCQHKSVSGLQKPHTRALNAHFTHPEEVHIAWNLRNKRTPQMGVVDEYIYACITSMTGMSNQGI